MDQTVSILATTFFGVTISAGAVLYVGNTYDISITKKTPAPEIVNRSIVQIPAPVEYIGDQTEAEYEVSQNEEWASKHCDTLTLIADNGNNPNGENYVMTISMGDLDVLNAAKRICPQHF